jgi:hypothetical protein
MAMKKTVPMAGNMEKMAVSSKDETATFVQVPGGHATMSAEVSEKCEVLVGNGITVIVSKRMFDVIGEEGIKEAMNDLEDLVAFRSGDDDSED